MHTGRVSSVKEDCVHTIVFADSLKLAKVHEVVWEATVTTIQGFESFTDFDPKNGRA